MPTINNNILVDAQTAIQNIPNVASGQITPASLVNRYQLTLASFGLNKVRAKVYRPGTKLPDAPAQNFQAGRQVADLDYSMHTGDNSKPLLSVLGTPVFCDMILSTQEADPERNREIQLVWVLAEVNLQKKVVKTEIQGRDGTVKEYINKGDYQVHLRGVLTSTFSNAYPKDEVRELIALCEYGKPLNVVSQYMGLFNIYNLVIEDASFGQDAGRQSSQKFEIKCVSDYPLVLRKKRNV